MVQLGSVPEAEESHVGTVPVLRWEGRTRKTYSSLSGNETLLGHAAGISTQEGHLKRQWSESCIRRLSSLVLTVLWLTHSGSPMGALLYHVYSSSGN